MNDLYKDAPGCGVKETASTNQLINDKTVSKMISMSCSWIRRERMRQRRGEFHVFTVTPVTIGNSPRYRFADVVAWMASLAEGGAS